MLVDATVESWGEWTFEDCVMQSCAGTALRLCFDGRSMLDRWSVCLLLLCLSLVALGLLGFLVFCVWFHLFLRPSYFPPN